MTVEVEQPQRVALAIGTGFLHVKAAGGNPWRINMEQIECYSACDIQREVVLRTKTGVEVVLGLTVSELDEVKREWSKPVIVGTSRETQRRLGFLDVRAGDGADYRLCVSVHQIESYCQITNRERLVCLRTKTGVDHFVHGTVEEISKMIDGWSRQP